ncbi:hypothetical protein [Kiritimatiella glycovorans]|uniref:DUF4034 domain-containing protein n=1 Tax=Kiritimatiella glycovorans TaxID=1307763 RepID=A0A0G3ELD3_9BACT|nr:hypothetical protein [Kiritimatiella glycovorans]AKJ65580.1 hypothetical protein L21SP4_02354 [Kiritimatiella glycovorans]
MKRRAVIGTLVLLLAAGAAWRYAFVRHEPLRERRRELGIGAVYPEEGMPPLISFTTVALGGFRGLLVDLLWMRAAELQSEGRYFEIVQLADWITKLEPELPEVWAYHAWNMAYNISVMFESPEDRWRWVRHGIQLLRDRGLEYNPGNPKLYFELAWLFQHKIGGSLDRAGPYYRQAWAGLMDDLLGGGSPDFAALREDDLAGFRLDPQRMAAVDRQYGPLDWRRPEAHAIYWIDRGLEHAREPGRKLMLQRVLYQSLILAYRNGSLIGETHETLFATAPNFNLFPRADAVLKDTMRAHPQNRGTRNAYANFLREAVVYFHAAGREQRSREIFERLGRLDPEATSYTDPARFAARYAAEYLLSIHREPDGVVEHLFYQAAAYARLGLEDRARARRAFAGEVHAALKAEYPGLAEAGILRRRARERMDRRLREATPDHPVHVSTGVFLSERPET